MYAENDFIPLSALQHYLFCKRQCALIHVERLWFENRFTAEGQLMHNKADKQIKEKRKECITEFRVPISSLQLGLVGFADVVEYRRINKHWLPFPIEYKRGKPKNNNCDTVQLCAQAMCLEEMLDTHILKGAIFYGKKQKRLSVEFNDSLRLETKTTAYKLHEMLDKFVLPISHYTEKCHSCSFFDI